MQDEPANPSARAAEVIFNGALGFAPAERSAYLAGACGNNADLRQRVEALLRAHEEAGGFLPEHPGMRIGLTDASTTRIVPITEKPGDRIGRYKLLQQIGEGGCGVVYMAEQEEPVRRRVALKVIKLGMDTKSVIARFEAERQALALMDHPNIAKVFDAGAIGDAEAQIADLKSEIRNPHSEIRLGRPYFVMELVRGIKITDYCDQNNLSTRVRLDLFIQVCHAIQHAHQKGIIHRDIKPSNILVNLQDGVPVPVVIDFGIAKATEQRLTDKTLFTAFEQFIGTPAYMSPEQAEMSRLDIDTRSDIYALGVLLYELLTGKTPFDAKTLVAAGLDEMRRIIREQEPVRPSTRITQERLASSAIARNKSTIRNPQSAIDPDLDWIVMKCLEKDRTRRYETANGLAMDIERHLSHQPVIARPPSTIYRTQKFIRRNKLVVTAAGLIAMTLLLGVAVSTWQALRARRAERQANAAFAQESAERQKALQAEARETKQRILAQEAERLAEQQAYAANINLAHQAWKESNLGRVRRLLAQTRPRPGQEDLRGWEWRYLWGLSQSDDSWEVARYHSMVWRIACAENGKLLTVGLLGRGVEDRGGFLYDLGLDRLSNQRLLGSNSVSVAVFLPRTDKLLCSGSDVHGRPGISEFDVHTLKEVRRLQTTNEVTLIRVSRDGQWLASLEKIAGHFANLRVRKTEDWDHCWSKPIRGDGTVNGGRIEFLDGGSRLAVGTEHGLVTIFETATGKSFLEFAAHSNDVIALAYVPVSRLLAVGAGYGDSTIRLWNPETGERVRELTGHKAWISDLAVSPDGRWLASASADQTVRLWNTQSWTNVALRGHEDEVYCLAFSADGKQLITGDKAGSVRLWTLPPLERATGPSIVAEYFWDIRLAPDSRRIVSFWPNGDYGVWDMDTGKKLDTLTSLGSCRGFPEFSPDGQQLLVGGPAGKIQVWDLARNSLSEFETGRSEEILPFQCMPGTNLVLMVYLTGHNTNASLWERWFLPDTRFHFTLWQFDQRRLVREFLAPDKVIVNAKLSSRGDFAMVHPDGSLTLQKITPPFVQTNFWPHPRGIHDIAFTPDGSRFATAGADGITRLWDVATGREIGPAFKAHLLSEIWALDISPDGRRLATAAGGQDAVKLWDLELHQELMTLSNEGSSMARIEFSRDGNKLVGFSGGAQHHLHIWRAPSWEEIAAAEAKAKVNRLQPRIL